MLGIVSLLLVILHILILHRTEPSSCGHLANDGVGQLVLILLKEPTLYYIFFYVFSFML